MNSRLQLALGLVALGFVASAISLATAASAPAPVSASASLPPDPTPLPKLQLPGHDVFRMANDAVANDKHNGPKDQTPANVALAYGVLGVYLDGANSTASIFDKDGIHTVALSGPNNNYHGHRVIAIAMDSVRLDDGTLIHRGLGVNNTSGSDVPAIVATPTDSPTEPSGTPSAPTRASDATPTPPGGNLDPFVNQLLQRPAAAPTPSLE